MAGTERLAEKVPGWVERLLIPTLETRVRAIVKEEVRDEVGHLEKTMVAKFDAVDTKIDALEKRFPMIQEIADLKARLAVVEERTAR